MKREKIVVALYGLPGSGKGTQANLVANTFGLVNFDTGKLLESIWHDPKRQKEVLVAKERKLFDSGLLNSPSFVLGEVEKKTSDLAKAGLGIVYSGSPRTMYEAEGLVPKLEKLYGKDHVFFFLLDVDEKDSLARNSKRRLCNYCKTGLLAQYYPSKSPKYCPSCAGSLYRRSVDDPKIIPKRLVEYKERTLPIVSYLKKHGHKVVKLNGRKAPYLVFQEIEKNIKKRLADSGR
jgi:adenylate kinase